MVEGGLFSNSSSCYTCGQRFWAATGWSKATVTNNISLMSLKIAKNGLTQWFLESFYAAVLVFWCLIMIRWNKSFISLFCQNGGLASARLNPAWTEPSNNPQRLPSSFNITKYHQNTPRLSLRHPKTSPNSIRHYRHHRISSKTFKVVYLVHHIWGAEWRWSHPTILAHQWNATFFPSDNFETSKYQNRRIKAF